MSNIIKVLTFLKGAEAAFELLSISKTGNSMDCFTSSTTADQLTHYWDDVLGRLSDDVLSCKVDGVHTPMSKHEIHAKIKTLHDGEGDNVLACLSRNGEDIELSNDLQSDTIKVPALITCDQRREYIRDLISVGSPKPKTKLPKYTSEELDEKISTAVKEAQEIANTEKLKALESLRKELEASREEHRSRLNEISQQKADFAEEISRLKAEMKLIKERKEESSKDAMVKEQLIRILEEENKRLTDETRKEVHSLKQGEKELKHINSEITREIENLRKLLNLKEVEIEDIKKTKELSKEKMEEIKHFKAELEKKMVENKRIHDEIEEARALAVQKDAEIQRLRDQIEIERSTKLTTTKRPRVAATTVSSLILLSTALGLASPVAGVGANLNPDPHLKNRPGTGKYSVDGITDAKCNLIDYSSVCPGFNLLSDMARFPFFNSHAHHRSILEAMHDNIIEKDNAKVCTVNDSNTPAACIGDLHSFNERCPENIRGVHYITTEGKYASMTCKDGHEVSENCKFCVKLKNPGSLTTASMPLQDAVCQISNTQYRGPIMKLKGVCSIGSRVYKRCQNNRQSYEKVPFVVLKGKGKHYLDTLSLRNKEQHAANAFLCHTYNRLIGETNSIDVAEKVLKRVKVSECKIVDTTKSKKCTGDAVFCNHYSCVRDFAEAYCTVAPGAGPIEVLYSGSWVTPVCVGYEMTTVIRETEPRRDTSSRDCLTCVTECSKDDIIIRSTGFGITSAVACSHGSCVSATQKASTEIRVRYPGLTASTGGSIGVHLSHDDPTTNTHVVVNCPPRDPCLVHNCIICTHGLINYQCHTAISAFVVVLLLTSSSLVALYATYKVLRILKIIPKKALSPLSWIYYLIMWIVRRIKSGWNRQMESLNREIGWNDPERGIVRPHRQPPIPRYAFKIGLFLSILTVASPCSETVVASSKITKCSTVDGRMVCTYSGTVTLRAGSIGSESCLILRGPSGETKKYISIKTVASELTCREGQTYWTGQFSPKCLSSRRCHLVAECKKTRCLEWRDDQLSNEFSGMGNNSVMNENKCFEQSGGIGYGCFNLNPSCLFVHAYFKSTKAEGLKVFSCVDWVHRIKFDVKNPAGNKETIIMGSMSTRFMEWGSMTLGLDAESISGSNSFSFMRNSRGEYAIVDEEFSTIPREGFIGEIRCNSESAVITAHKSCLRAPNLIKYRPMLDLAECTTSLVDPFTVFKRGALPQTRNGKTFAGSIDRTTVQAMSNAVIQAEITLVLDGFDVEFETTTAICSASFLNISGCYSCNEGAQVCLKIKSDKQGVFTAHNKDMTVNFMTHVTPGTEEVCKILHFGQPEIRESLLYSCGGEESPVIIKGTLIAYNPFDDRSESGGSSTIVNPKGGDWDIMGWASGLFSWLGGPIKAVLMIIGYIILALLTLVIILALGRMLITHLIDLRRSKNK
uniref:Envelopment polyprotein n=1 Tax=Ntepes virus TaxID=2569589 RepID=A0A7G8PYL3_9VIRU|nr:glycoprotein precursor [Ntepes virus]